MRSRSFFSFVLLFLIKHKAHHLFSFFMTLLLVWLLSSVLFLATSLHKESLLALKNQADFLVQRFEGGSRIWMDESRVDAICDIRGIDACEMRVYGKYYYGSDRTYFDLVGIDFFDPKSLEMLETHLDNFDLKEFLSEPSMVVGSDVADFMRANYYRDYFHFKTANGESLKLRIYRVFDPKSWLSSAHVALMPQEVAKKILGFAPHAISDVAVSVANELELERVRYELLQKGFDLRVVAKSDYIKSLEQMYNLKGGFFLILFMMSGVSFFLILYQRYTTVSKLQRGEIALLRALGWSITDVLNFKASEALFVALGAFLLALVLGYFYVFVLQAPLLKDIFLGSQNLAITPRFLKVYDFGLFVTLFLLFIVPYIAATLLPAYRVAMIEPSEALR